MRNSIRQVASTSRVLLSSSSGRATQQAHRCGNLDGYTRRSLSDLTSGRDADQEEEEKRKAAAWNSLLSSVSGVTSTTPQPTSTKPATPLTDYLAGGGRAPKSGVRVPLFNTLRGSGGGIDGVGRDVGLVETADSSSTISDEVDERIARDARSMELIKAVAKFADRGDTVATINACTRLRKRLTQLRVAFGYEHVLYPPRAVFVKLLSVLADAGEFDLCEETLDVQRQAGIAITMREMDLTLYAAVKQKNQSSVEKVLQQISTGSSTEGGSIDVDARESVSGSQVILAGETQNWTAQTFKTMLLQCSMTRNLEYALALIAAASHRSDSTMTDKRPTFLASVLQPDVCVLIITMMGECREARLAADFALWTEEHVTFRKHRLRTWMTVLQCCAHEDWWPGVEVAWNRTVVYGLLAIDEGLLLSVLRCASRARKVDFIKRALDSFLRSSPSAATLQEWHLSPLFEAQCLAHDFDGAIRTARQFAPTSSTSNRLLSLVNTAAASMVDLRSAYHAFVTIGTDISAEGGVSEEILAALIRAANSCRSHETALKLFAVRHYLRSFSTSGGGGAKGLFPVPVELRDMTVPSDESDALSVNAALDMLIASEQKFRLESGQAKGADRKARTAGSSDTVGVVPTIQVYNALLSTAIDTESRELGRFVFEQINKTRCAANETTYERAIILSVTQPSYEDGFKLLDECKVRNLRPTRATYQALGLRCLKENDDRWVSIGREMLDLDYYPGHDLYEELIRGNWIRSDKLTPFNVPYSRPARSRPGPRER